MRRRSGHAREILLNNLDLVEEEYYEITLRDIPGISSAMLVVGLIFWLFGSSTFKKWYRLLKSKMSALC